MPGHCGPSQLLECRNLLFNVAWGYGTTLVTVKELLKARLGYDVISFHPPTPHLTKRKLRLETAKQRIQGHTAYKIESRTRASKPVLSWGSHGPPPLHLLPEACLSCPQASYLSSNAFIFIFLSQRRKWLHRKRAWTLVPGRTLPPTAVLAEGDGWDLDVRDLSISTLIFRAELDEVVSLPS